MNIHELEDKIIKASEAYYLEQPIMSDKEFDTLLEDLTSKDPDNKILTSVGWGLKVYGSKVKIPKQIKSSLPKIKDVSEVAGESDKVYSSLKVDGMSVILEYEKGILKSAITRGDGVYGIDITQKVKHIKGLSLTDSNKERSVVVRGELYIPVSVFMKNLSEDYANPRNSVSGIINSKSFDNLEYVHFIEHPFQPEFINGNDRLSLTLCDKSINWENFFENEKSMKDFPIDGLCLIDVVPCHTYKLSEDIINHVYALKLKTEEVETVVESVNWKLSERGKYIPVVHYKEVELYGTKCSNASAYHYQYAKENNIGVGTKIKLTKANEIIPYITEIVESTKFEEPVVEHKTKIDGVNLVVDNIEIQTNIIFKNFLSYHFNFEGYKKADELLEIFGASNVYQLVHKFDSPEIDIDKLLKDNGVNTSVRPTLIDKLLKQKCNFNNFFSQFGINGVGESSATKLQPIALEYVQIFGISTVHDIMDNLGKVLDKVSVNKNVREILLNFEIAEVIYSCYKTFESKNKWLFEEKEVIDYKLNVVITGSLSIPKSEMKKKLKEYRVNVLPSMSKNVNILITNDKSSNSSKMKYAKKNNLEILTEDEIFKKLIEQNND